MRVSDYWRTRRTLDAFQTHQGEIDRLSIEVSSGKKVFDSSQDAIAYGKLMENKDSLFDTELYKGNTEAFKSRLDSYESKIDGLTTTLRNMKVLLLGAGNSATMDPDTYTTQMETMLKQVLSIANSQEGGAFLFSGSRNQTRPFEATYSDGKIDQVTYMGDSAETVMNASAGIKLRVGLSGQDVFSGAAGMGEDVFQVMIDVKNDLADGKLDQLNSFLEKTDNIINRLVEKRGEIGSNGQILDQMGSFLDGLKENLDGRISKTESVDMAEAITTLMSRETVYRAAMEAASTLNNLTMLNYMD